MRRILSIFFLMYAYSIYIFVNEDRPTILKNTNLKMYDLDFVDAKNF